MQWIRDGSHACYFVRRHHATPPCSIFISLTIFHIYRWYCSKAESANMKNFETGQGRKFQYHPGKFKKFNFFHIIKDTLKLYFKEICKGIYPIEIVCLKYYGTIQIIRGTFKANFRPPSPPPCVIWWHCPIAPPPRCVAWQIFFLENHVFNKQIHQNEGNFFGKMSRDTSANPSLPLAIFGDTAPPMCHVLFEWPLLVPLKSILFEFSYSIFTFYLVGNDFYFFT